MASPNVKEVSRRRDTCPLAEEPAASLANAMRAEMATIYDGLNIDNPSMPTR